MSKHVVLDHGYCGSKPYHIFMIVKHQANCKDETSNYEGCCIKVQLRLAIDELILN